MYCSKCGNNNNPENKYCVNCGNNLNSVNSTNQTDGNKETSLVLGIICLVSSFFINILCFIPGIISIVYARKYKKDSGKLGAGFGLSLAGMIFSFIMFLISLLLILFIIGVINETNNEWDYKYNYETEYTYNLPNI